jgi:nucleoid DNA-binding protein
LKRKTDLDRDVAFALGISPKKVHAITFYFLKAAREALLEDGDVYLDTLGRLHLCVSKSKPATLKMGNFKPGESTGQFIAQSRKKYFVYFRKSIALKRDIVEKFGKAKVTHGQK